MKKSLWVLLLLPSIAMADRLGSLNPNSQVLLSTQSASSSPGGSNTNVQYNNSGSLGGDNGFQYDSSASSVSISGGLQTGTTVTILAPFSASATGARSLRLLNTGNGGFSPTSGGIGFYARNTSASDTEFSKIVEGVNDATAGSENGQLGFSVKRSGSFDAVPVLQLKGDSTFGYNDILVQSTAHIKPTSGSINLFDSSTASQNVKFWGNTTAKDGNLTYDSNAAVMTFDHPWIFSSSSSVRGTLQTKGLNTSTFTITSITSQNCLGTDSSGNVIAGTCGGGITPGSTFYIQNTNSLQSSSTFYVSSGTVNGTLTTVSDDGAGVPGLVVNRIGGPGDPFKIQSVLTNEWSLGSADTIRLSAPTVKIVASSLDGQSSAIITGFRGESDIIQNSATGSALVLINGTPTGPSLKVGTGSGVTTAVINGVWLANGQLGAGTQTPGAQLHVVPVSASTIAQIIQSTIFQTAELTEWQDSNGVVLAAINKDGNVGIGGLAPSGGSNDHYISINRGSSGNDGEIIMQTNGTNDWLYGQGNTGSGPNSDFHTYSYGIGKDAVTIKKDSGFFGLNVTAPGAQMEVDSSSSNTIGIISKGFASQSADLQEWQDSSAAALLSVNSAGQLVSSSGNETTGSAATLFGSNCPAVTCTSPYTWIKMKTSDGSTVYMPVFK